MTEQRDDSLDPDVSEEELAVQIDNAIPTRAYQTDRVVGLGGSAGSIAALQRFFAQMPPEPGMAFIVVLHLSPSHDSSLAAVLAKATTMPVVQAGDGQAIELNHVYVIPPEST
jgi:two-component system CheB/CheR fusion protein